MQKKILAIHTVTKHTSKKVYKRITRSIIKYPGRSFFTVLGALFLLIIIGNIVSRPHTNTAAITPAAKTVDIYGIGSAPRIDVTAHVEKSGVVKVIAQSSGIVQKVYVAEGATVGRGDWIAWLSTNYQGGTLPTVTRQIAQKNYAFVNDNYDAQKGLIDKQRAIADSSQTQFTDMRTITSNSINDTQNLINQDQDIVNSLNDQITYLETTYVGSDKDTLLLQAKQGRAGAQAGLNALKVALSQAQYQTNTDNAPTNLATTQHDLAIAQLDLQQKSLDLNRELAGLNLQMAQISESLMYPVSPVSGTVERVYVSAGQNVSNGTVLAEITGDKTVSTIVALVPKETAKNISRLESSRIIIGTKTIDAYPRYISSEATDGGMNTVLFSIPPEDESVVTNGSTVTVQLPIGSEQTTSAVPYVPLDSLYQTQTDSYVYVASPSAGGTQVAKSTKVTLGVVYGDYVEVKSGLGKDDQVIVTRNVVDGDTVTFK